MTKMKRQETKRARVKKWDIDTRHQEIWMKTFVSDIQIRWWFLIRIVWCTLSISWVQRREILFNKNKGLCKNQAFVYSFIHSPWLYFSILCLLLINYISGVTILCLVLLRCFNRYKIGNRDNMLYSDFT